MIGIICSKEIKALKLLKDQILGLHMQWQLTETFEWGQWTTYHLRDIEFVMRSTIL